MVTVRSTGDGPFGEDLYLDFEGTGEFGRLSVPSGAEGFDRLLEAVTGYLPGFDMDSVVTATMQMEESQHVVWQRR